MLLSMMHRLGVSVPPSIVEELKMQSWVHDVTIIEKLPAPGVPGLMMTLPLLRPPLVRQTSCSVCYSLRAMLTCSQVLHIGRLIGRLAAARLLLRLLRLPAACMMLHLALHVKWR